MDKQKITSVKVHIGGELHTCNNCGNQFKGKICNDCGEKVFHSSHLSVAHYLEQVIDFFTHFENKVLKSIWLNFSKPAFITKENLRGVTVPYARPVQLFIMVNLIFYFTVSFLHVTDYAPAQGDQHTLGLSNYKIFSWAAPFDNRFVSYIDSTGAKKQRTMAEERIAFAAERQTDYKLTFDSSGKHMLDYELAARFNNNYTEKVGEYSKLMVVILIPFMALIFYLFFYKRLESYGAALIFATHFMAYNLLIFSLNAVVTYLPSRITHNDALFGIPMQPFYYVFYNPSTTALSTSIFGPSFEMLHFIMWVPWLWLAFKRLFNPRWFINVIACYFSVRIFYFLIFGLYKKFLILFTFWMMHV